MILLARDYRRLVNRFVDYGVLNPIHGGGMRMTIIGCPFQVSEICTWEKNRYVTDYVILHIHNKWKVNLFDTNDGKGRRLITQVCVMGDLEQAKREMRLFLLRGPQTS